MKNEEQKVKIEVRKPFFLGEREIVRKTKEDGTVIYEESFGIKREIETTDQELDVILRCILERFDALTELVAETEEDIHISMLYGALIKQIKMEIDEMFEFIYEDIGEINLTWMNYSSVHDRGCCVGAFVEALPKKGGD